MAEVETAPRVRLTTKKPIGSCADCWFFEGLGDKNGECRRHAPHGVNEHGDGTWPLVQESDWCGDFESVLDEPPEIAHG